MNPTLTDFASIISNDRTFTTVAVPAPVCRPLSITPSLLTPVSHKSSATLMAEGYARASSSGCGCSCVGSLENVLGTVDLMMASLDAGIPLIVICGAPPLVDSQPIPSYNEETHQRSAFHKFRPVNAIDNSGHMELIGSISAAFVSLTNEVIENLVDIDWAISCCFEKHGPVVLQVPSNVFLLPISVSNTRSLSSTSLAPLQTVSCPTDSQSEGFRHRLRTLDTIDIHQDTREEMAEAIRIFVSKCMWIGKFRPAQNSISQVDEGILFVMGRECQHWWSGNWALRDALMSFVEAFSIPFVIDESARSAFNERHSLCLGTLTSQAALSPNDPLLKALSSANLVVSFGTLTSVQPANQQNDSRAKVCINPNWLAINHSSMVFNGELVVEGFSMRHFINKAHHELTPLMRPSETQPKSVSPPSSTFSKGFVSPEHKPLQVQVRELLDTLEDGSVVCFETDEVASVMRDFALPNNTLLVPPSSSQPNSAFTKALGTCFARSDNQNYSKEGSPQQTDANGSVVALMDWQSLVTSVPLLHLVSDFDLSLVAVVVNQKPTDLSNTQSELHESVMDKVEPVFKEREEHTLSNIHTASLITLTSSHNPDTPTEKTSSNEESSPSQNELETHHDRHPAGIPALSPILTAPLSLGQRSLKTIHMDDSRPSKSPTLESPELKRVPPLNPALISPLPLNITPFFLKTHMRLKKQSDTTQLNTDATTKEIAEYENVQRQEEHSQKTRRRSSLNVVHTEAGGIGEL
ncbi:hypothetical protein BLNAU_11191 [Blattamonas nauphoetae]|uniref:Pyruvate decarboxylase n=1 Tax=Blattamonas nauphoetae TaxID=2049346 RepID=A0ABQ9XND3_9EUKA|nr:hypothetical protein BLNAU_11191 [Blattamonas nauphoetae]